MNPKDMAPVIHTATNGNGWFTTGPYYSNEGVRSWRVHTPEGYEMAVVNTWKEANALVDDALRAFAPIHAVSAKMAGLADLYRDAHTSVKPGAIAVTPYQFDAFCDLPEQFTRMGEMLRKVTFALESVAHLRGLERQLLPTCDESRALLALIMGDDPSKEVDVPAVDVVKLPPAPDAVLRCVMAIAKKHGLAGRLDEVETLTAGSWTFKDRVAENIREARRDLAGGPVKLNDKVVKAHICRVLGLKVLPSIKQRKETEKFMRINLIKAKVEEDPLRIAKRAYAALAVDLTNLRAKNEIGYNRIMETWRNHLPNTGEFDVLLDSEKFEGWALKHLNEVGKMTGEVRSESHRNVNAHKKVLRKGKR